MLAGILVHIIKLKTTYRPKNVLLKDIIYWQNFQNLKNIDFSN